MTETEMERLRGGREGIEKERDRKTERETDRVIFHVQGLRKIKIEGAKDYKEETVMEMEKERKRERERENESKRKREKGTVTR